MTVTLTTKRCLPKPSCALSRSATVPGRWVCWSGSTHSPNSTGSSLRRRPLRAFASSSSNGKAGFNNLEGYGMPGWDVGIYRQTDGGVSPATDETPAGACLAVWQTGVYGLAWLDELVWAGKAIDLGGGGLRWRYTATAEQLVPRIAENVLTKWEGRKMVIDMIDHAVVADCRRDEWLLVEAWDD